MAVNHFKNVKKSSRGTSDRFRKGRKFKSLEKSLKIFQFSKRSTVIYDGGFGGD